MLELLSQLITDWTQAELGEKLNLTDKAISRWETGESMPETNQLLPLSKIFSITIDELLNGERYQIFQTILYRLFVSSYKVQ